MRSIEDKKLCYLENNSTGLVFEFHHKGNNHHLVGANTNNNSNNSTTARSSTNSGHGRHRSTALGKLSGPSKWDDAQKWLVGLSRGGSGDQRTSQANKNKPRNSNADDLRLIASIPHKEQDYSSEEEENPRPRPKTSCVEAEKTKNVDCASSAEAAIWRINKPVGPTAVCVRDMGTEMTPIASQEPSRTATPVRATTPVARSPAASGASTPMRPLQGSEGIARGNGNGSANSDRDGNKSGAVGGLNPLETRAVAWDEAERAKYMARYKREEVKIQAWENHEKRKAEMEMKKMEVKAERIKARAEEKMANKLAATRRIAEEKRANAEAKLNEKAVRTSERADYIRRTGHLPSSFYFKLPSLNCW